MWKFPAFAIFSFAIATVLVTASARANEKVSVRAWAHDSFGRIVFDVKKPVAHSAKIVDGKLVIEFSRPITASFAKVFRHLNAYVENGTSEMDGKRVLLQLKGDFELRSFVDDGKPVFDLLKTTAKKGAPPERVRVRTGRHKKFTRLVFDWPSRVGYRVKASKGVATIRFQRRAAIDIKSWKKELPKHVRSFRAQDIGSATQILLAHGAQVKLRHFRDGPRIVIDLFEPPPGKTKKLALRQQKSLRQYKKTVKSISPKPVSLTPPSSQPGRPVQLTKASEAEVLIPVRIERNGNAVSLTFDWGRPAGVAAFTRAGYIWVVFDRFRNFVLDDVLAKEKRLLKNVEHIPSRKGTVIRIGPVPGLYPTLRRGGNSWVVDIRPEVTPPLAEIPVQALSNKAGGLELLLRADGAEDVIRVLDPEVGDELLVVPVAVANTGMRVAREYVDFALLASAQGIVLEPRKDSLKVKATVRGVRIFGAETLRVSMPGGSNELQSVSDALLTSVRIFDFDGWRGLPEESFINTEQRLRQDLSVVDEAQLDDARMHLARFYFANAWMPETLAILTILKEMSPGIVEDMNFRAIRGAALFQTGVYSEAKKDLYHSSLDGDAEIALWRAALAAKEENWTQAMRGFDGADSFLGRYPPSLQVPLSLLAAEAAYRVGGLELAEARLRALRILGLGAAESGDVEYLEGHIRLARRDPDGAIVLWDRVAAGEGRESSARATFARILLQRKQGEIDLGEAIEQLEKLRFAWRGGEFEFNLLHQLGKLYLDEKKYVRGLTALKQLITYFDGEERKQKIVQEMTNVFKTLYLEGEADKMPLVKALALYNSFRELTPVGKNGDRMIEKLTDRLVDADLLDRAAKLLDYQVEYRLSGKDKARVATRLALVQLLNHNPEHALKALRETATQPVSEDLARQRLHLTVRALAEVGKTKQALKLLSEDASYKADLLRIDIYQRTQDWSKAAEIFPRLLGDPAPDAELEARDLKFILSWAVALSLGDDMEGLKRLHARFDKRMEASSYASMFRVISPDAEHTGEDFLGLASKIADVDNFQAFMTGYRRQLKEKGLSALN
ncbi:MAG: hypothetical protein COA65_09315 [Rhodospirillaceae bacterium]|nr:MAG: hypothetical protein COA65_09315 [Rhodospirillaceae bacterium]